MLNFPVHLQVIIFFFLFVTSSSSLSSADAYLSGTITETGTTTPIDSVRVTSSLYTAVCYTTPEGAFSLPFSNRLPCRTDTQIIVSGKEYSVTVSVNETTYRLVSDKPLNSVTARLFDLRGRSIAFVLPADNHSLQFPENDLTPGTYLLEVAGFPVKRFFIANRRFRGTLSTTSTLLREISPPNCPSDDTIYYCKQGYWPAVMSITDARKSDTLSLTKKRWLSFDIHHHTLLTDGVKSQDSVLYYAFTRFGLDLCANSEHGGSYFYDTAGTPIIDDAWQSEHAPRTNGSSYIPRWYTLTEYSWPKITGQRTVYPDKLLLQGLEWNVPGHEHASVGFIDDRDQPEAISDFEYQFDFNDLDTSRTELPKHNRRWVHDDALFAVGWLKRHYPQTSYFFINHPSREALGSYPVNAFRDFNNLAPGICFAFEGIPGHHKMYTRGKYTYGTGTRNRTWGGADYICAKLGGLWDALLGEGRHFWTIVNSDFHNLYEDHWPGEYTKSRVAVRDTGAQAWLDGMREGELFGVLGDLVSELEFIIDDGIHASGMGSDVHSYSDTLSVIIRFISPAANYHGDAPQVDHVDLIAGPVTGKIDPSDEKYYSPEHPATKVVKRFYESDWTEENGWSTIRTTVVCKDPAYYRLRGTSNVIGKSGHVDENGEPTMDPPGAHTEEIAWKDLWFYSNPIFVYPR